MRSGATFGGCCCSNVGGAVDSLDSVLVVFVASGFSVFSVLAFLTTTVFVVFPPFLFASCAAKYSRLLVSNSGSCRYSSSDCVRLVGACLRLGICSRVEVSKRLAVWRYSTTSDVCLVNVL